MDPSAKMPLLLTRENIKQQFLNEFDTILLDLDGTVWKQDGVGKIEKVADAYNFLRAAGKRIFFLTNCAKLSRRKLKEKLADFGIDTGMRYIYTAGYATAQYLKQRLGPKAKTYAMVDQGFKEELEDLGVTFIGFGLDTSAVIPQCVSIEEIQQIYLDPDVGAVVVGLDPWFSITKLFKAASHLQNPKCLFLTTDMGGGIELAPGYVLPSTGALVAAVKTASGRESPIVVGKPNPHIIDLIKQEHVGVDLQRAIVIGDKVSTDIKFARVHGLPSVLVMTGHATEEQLVPMIDHVLGKRYSVEEQKKFPPRYKCCSKEKDTAKRCPCVPTFLLPSFGDIGIWLTPPPKEVDTCACYVPQVSRHDICGTR